MEARRLEERAVTMAEVQQSLGRSQRGDNFYNSVRGILVYPEFAPEFGSSAQGESLTL